MTCQRSSGKRSTRHPLCFSASLFLWFLASWFGTISIPVLASLFFIARPIPIDMATKQKVGIGCFLFFTLFWLFQHSFWPKRWHISWSQLQQHNMPEVKRKTIDKASPLLLCFSASLCLGFGKLVAKQSNRTIGVPVLASLFFVTWPIQIDMPNEPKSVCCICIAGVVIDVLADDQWWSHEEFFIIGKSRSLALPRPTALKGVNAVYCLHLFLFQELSSRLSAGQGPRNRQRSQEDLFWLGRVTLQHCQGQQYQKESTLFVVFVFVSGVVVKAKCQLMREKQTMILQGFFWLGVALQHCQGQQYWKESTVFVAFVFVSGVVVEAKCWPRTQKQMTILWEVFCLEELLSSAAKTFGIQWS